MFYDHFLASQWEQFSPMPLKRFTRRFYRAMVWHFRILLSRVKGFLPHLIACNRLYVYATLEGLQCSLEIMENYRTLPQKSGEAIALLKENYSRFRDGFNEFFPDLQAFVASRL
ncbi:MAG: acyl carrier protein phosphodiesterase [Prevotellaceae bacterium]|nr:acyl carrier protein phosphodiesterase [Prevotellaceae bacterium]